MDICFVFVYYIDNKEKCDHLFLDYDRRLSYKFFQATVGNPVNKHNSWK